MIGDELVFEGFMYPANGNKSPRPSANVIPAKSIAKETNSKMGVSRRDTRKITGHKTEHVFGRYNMKTTEDVGEALIKVGQFSPAAVTAIAEKSTTR
jgi:hypothetical protein